ncbi:MAG: hypothetical protein KGH94_04475 [Candidatus Micrarchaeota archaeon]|nr:hypothetical protein [Candidatus Micrarchaeota archaeon]
MPDDILQNMEMAAQAGNRRARLIIEAAVVIILVLILAYAAYHLSNGSTAAARHVPPNATVIGLVSQVNPSWNASEINSTMSNSSYVMSSGGPG